MASYLITGSSRGLGLAMVTHLANSSPSDARVVFATARSQTPDLKKLIEKSAGRVVFVEMDTTDQSSVDKAVKFKLVIRPWTTLPTTPVLADLLRNGRRNCE